MIGILRQLKCTSTETEIFFFFFFFFFFFPGRDQYYRRLFFVGFCCPGSTRNIPDRHTKGYACLVGEKCRDMPIFLIFATIHR